MASARRSMCDSCDVGTPCFGDVKDWRTADFLNSLARLTTSEWDEFGPPTACWCTDAQAGHGSAMGYHSRWRADLRLDPPDPGVQEQETLSRILDAAVIYDKLHGSQVACLEMISWPLLRIQVRYKDGTLGRFASNQTGDNDGNKNDDGRATERTTFTCS